MIREAIEKVQALACEATGRVLFKADAEPKDVYFIRQPDGTLVRHVAEPSPRNYTATSLPGLCDQVRHFAGGMEDVCIFIGDTAIRAVLGEAARRHSVVLPLACTEGYSLLQQAATELAELSQADLLWILRTSFRGNVHPATLIPDIKQIKFRSSSNADTELGQGRASIGKSVMAEMVGAGGELPEEIQLVCPVYEDLGDAELKLEYTFLLALAVNLAEQEFTLKPLPGEINAARLKVGEAIAERLTWQLGDLVSSGKVKVFRHSAAV